MVRYTRSTVRIAVNRGRGCREFGGWKVVIEDNDEKVVEDEEELLSDRSLRVVAGGNEDTWEFRNQCDTILTTCLLLSDKPYPETSSCQTVRLG